MTELNEREMRKISEYFCLPGGNEPQLAIWIIGRPAAGKSTTAALLRDALRQLGRCVEVVDGEVVRQTFDRAVGYSKEDRVIMARRLIHINKFLQSRRVIPVTATICGLRLFRKMVRQNVTNVQFVYLDCPFEVAVRRDPKGLYAKALRGEVKNFFGVDIDFEEPTEYALKIDSADLNPSEVVARILGYLAEKDFFPTQGRNGRGQLHE